MALVLALLDHIAGCDDHSHVLLSDHSPHIHVGVIKWSLACDNLAVVDRADWAINEVRIDVAAYKRINIHQTLSRQKVHP